MRIVINPDELGQDPALGCRLAASLGLQWIEIRTAYGSNAINLERQQLRGLRKLAKSFGLEIAALASPLFKWDLKGRERTHVDKFGFPTALSEEGKLSAILRAIDAARNLETRFVRIFSNIRPAAEDIGILERFADDPLLRIAIELAQSAEMELLLENEPVCTVASAVELESFFDSASGRSVGLWLDFANLHEMNDSTSAVIAKLAALVRYSHIKDFSFREGKKSYCAAGEGDVPLRSMINMLKPHKKADLFCAVETHVKPDAERAIRETVNFLERHF